VSNTNVKNFFKNNIFIEKKLTRTYKYCKLESENTLDGTSDNFLQLSYGGEERRGEERRGEERRGEERRGEERRGEERGERVCTSSCRRPRSCACRIPNLSSLSSLMPVQRLSTTIFDPTAKLGVGPCTWVFAR
jgi:hypothetical protein